MAGEASPDIAWKGTFISMGNRHQSPLQRSNSEPELSTRSLLLEDSDFFKDERIYVKKLGERVEKLWAKSSSSAGYSADNCNAFDRLKSLRRAVFTEQQKTQTSRPSEHVQKTASNILRVGHAVHSEDVHSPAEHRQVQADTSLELMKSIRDTSPGEVLEVFEQLETQKQSFSKMTNAGSAGHPEFCNRACIYFPVGECSSGDSCNFCHEVHPQRSPHLDKINRATLKALPDGARNRLFLLALQERASSVLPSDKYVTFSQILNDLSTSVPNSFSASNETEGWRDSRLFTSLLKMHLSSLISLLLQNCSTEVDVDRFRLIIQEFRSE